jgi:nitrous oxidase accessory protein NosD
VTVSGVADASYNGTYTIVSVGGTTFTYANAGANSSSSGGQVFSGLQIATIYSDNSGTVKANPFTAGTDSTWFFYANPGNYDVKFSGGGIANPFTLGALGNSISTYLGAAYISAADMLGTDASVKIAAAISILPASGGVIDATALIGAQAWSVDPFIGAGKPVVLVIGESTHTISAIVKPPSNSMIVGRGRGSVLNFVDDGTATSRQLYLLNVTDIVIQGVTITSTAASRTAVYGLIRTESSSRISILNNTLLTSPSTSIWTMTTTDLLIQGNTCIGPFADGIHITRQSTRVRIQGNTISGTGDDGIGLISYTDPDGSKAENTDITVIGNIIDNVGVGRGIAVSGGSQISIIGNTVTNIDQAGIIISGASGALSTSSTHFPRRIVVSGNTIYNTGRQSILGTGAGIYVAPARMINVTDNVIDVTALDGITLASVTKDINVSDNTISRTTGTGITINPTSSTDSRLIQELFTDLGETGVVTAVTANIKIDNNDIRKTTGTSIFVNSTNMTGIRVTNNEIADSPTQNGIDITGCKYLVVNGNTLMNVAQGIRIGNGNRTTINGNMVTTASGTAVLLVTSQYTVISGNVFADNSVIGVFVDGTSSNNFCIDNIFINNGTDIQDTAGDTTASNRFGSVNQLNVTKLAIQDLEATLSTTATNGTGPAMPANVEKFVTFSVNGTILKLIAVKP